VANGKRFIAYEIFERLKKKQSHKVLMQLQEGLSVKQLEKGKHHKVFEESFDAKPIYHRQFLIQKITCMHLNPVRGMAGQQTGIPVACFHFIFYKFCCICFCQPNLHLLCHCKGYSSPEGRMNIKLSNLQKVLIDSLKKQNSAILDSLNKSRKI